VPAGQALLRSGARAGDDVWVSGDTGDARIALEVFRGTLQVSAALFAQCRERMEQPTPRVALGQALRGIAHAAVDLSDGLLGDLGHILAASRVGATIEAAAALPLLGAARHADWRSDAPAASRHLEFVLAGGDDYELAFTAPSAARAAVQAAAAAAGTRATRIGRIDTEPGLRVVDATGQPLAQRFTSFDHFA
jgi:thiamine-monophosphate kinase